MHRPRTWLQLAALVLFAAWLLSVIESFGPNYIGAAVDRWRIAAVERGSPAEEGGVRAGDVFAPPGNFFRRVPGTSGRLLEARLLRDGAATDVVVRPRQAPPVELAWRTTLAVVGLGMILLGLWVYRRRPQPATALFLFLSLALAIVTRPVAGFPSWVPVSLGEWTVLAAEVFFPALMIHFVLIFPPGPARPVPGRGRLALLYSIPALFLFAEVPALWLHASDPRLAGDWNVALETGVVIYFPLAILTATVIFFRTYRRAHTAVERSRLRVALWGTILGLLPVAAMAVLIRFVPIERMPWSRYVGLSLLLVPAAFADAALRHRLFDFEVVFKRSLVYSTWAAFSLALYVVLSQVAGRWLSSVTHLPESLWPALAVFLGGVLFVPTRERLSAAADQLFLRGPFDYRQTLVGLARDLARVESTEEMVERGLPEIARALRLGRLAYFEANGADRFRLMRSLDGVPAQQGLAVLEVPGSCCMAGMRGAMPWDLDTAEWSGLPAESRRKLDSLGASALVPVRFAERLQGLWILGARPGTAWYEPADLALLDEFSEQCGRALDHRHLQRQVEAQAHLQKELRVAHDIQKQLIPLHCPIYPTLDLAGESVPCEEVGGDYFDFVPQGEERFGFVIADSSGKGVPAALLMAGLQAQFRAEAPRHPHPTELLELINSRTAPSDDPRRFVSLLYAVVDVASRTLRYCNGGHPPPLRVRSDGTVEQMPGSGFLLGVMPEARYEEEMVRLSRGDLLVFFTDGVVEERSGDELFGDERLERLISKHRHERCHRLVRTVLEEVQAFVGHPLSDDVTVVAMKFL